MLYQTFGKLEFLQRWGMYTKFQCLVQLWPQFSPWRRLKPKIAKWLSNSKSKPCLLSTFIENHNYFLLYLGFFRVQLGNRTGWKINRSHLRLAPLFQKPLIIVSDDFLTLDLFLSPTPKGWKESIGVPDTELHAKSFEKNSLKKINYSRRSPSCYWGDCFFTYFDWLRRKKI